MAPTREARMRESAQKVSYIWPLIAAHLGCAARLEPVENLPYPLATRLDAEGGVDYFTCRIGTDTLLPIATRTHPSTHNGRRYSGWTIRYKRPRTGAECEYQRLLRAIEEPAGTWPRVLIEIYADGTDEYRVYAARISDLIRTVQAQLLEHSEEQLRFGPLRENSEDGVLFFGLSAGNLRARGYPVWRLKQTATKGIDLFGEVRDPAEITCEHGAPARLWKLD
jgi:hypothetical protein